MSLKRLPEFLSFLSTVISETDPENDLTSTREYFDGPQSAKKDIVASQIKSLLNSNTELSVEEFGSEANRWFGSSEEAREWLTGLLSVLSESDAQDASGASDTPVKDSNGAVLTEGDSVTVIKDLKVKGGSSDLKRGTLIKKIHLIGDPDNIECRVGGSTLVLKTCFLKKA